MAMCKFIRILWHVTWKKSMPNSCDFVLKSCLREVFFWLFWRLHVFILICVLKLREIFTIHFYLWTLFFSKGMIIVLHLMFWIYIWGSVLDIWNFILVFKNRIGFGLCHLSDSWLFMNSTVLEPLGVGLYHLYMAIP